MCGTRAAQRCGSCGGPLEAEFRFCPQCGHAVGEPAVVEPPPAPPVPAVPAVPADGERKQVTVLFCDLVGSTAIAERLDPEEYRDIIDRYLQRVVPEVDRFRGL